MGARFGSSPQSYTHAVNVAARCKGQQRGSYCTVGDYTSHIHTGIRTVPWQWCSCRSLELGRAGLDSSTSNERERERERERGSESEAKEKRRKVGGICREAGMAGLVRQARGAGLLHNLARFTSLSSMRAASTVIGQRILLQQSDFVPDSGVAKKQQQQCRDMATAAWDYRGQRQLLPFGGRVPSVAVDAFVAPNVVLAGSVDVQDRASVFYGCVLRGDLNKIVVGFCSNVGDKCVLHAAASSPTGLSAETLIGKYVTVGNFSTLRSCTIEDEVVIGERCVIMEGSIVETHAILEAGSVVPPGRRIPAGEVWAGMPARFVREVTYDEIAAIPRLAEGIREIAEEHMGEFLPYSTAYLELEKLKSSALAAQE